VRQQVVREETSSRKGWLGCLVVLAAFGGLLYPVLREIIEAVLNLFK
jgi:hypothetical protein